jgi:glycolate oxidase
MKGRRMLNYALDAKGGRLAEDACVPIARLAQFVRVGQRSASGLAWRSPSPAMVATATCIRRCSSPAATPTVCTGPRRRWTLLRAALDLGGTITGEHGIGLQKRAYLEWELGSAELARQRSVKALFDPRGIMNPGKVY